MKNLSLKSILEGQLGLVHYDQNQVVTLDWIQVSHLLKDMTEVRTDWDNVTDGVRKTIKVLRTHGVLPYETTEKIHIQLGTVDHTITTVLKLLQNLEQFPTPKKPQSTRHVTNLKFEIPS
jgi:hypothetical protein